MNTIKLFILALAVVVGIPVAAAIAAHQFGTDSLAIRGQVPAAVEMVPADHDRFCFINDALSARPGWLKSSEFPLKAVRA